MPPPPLKPTQVTVRAPSARAVCECVAAKNPARLYGLRKDTLGVLLSAANVGTGARVLCVDGCAGLLLGAAAERLGGHGYVSRRLELYFSQGYYRQCVCVCVEWRKRATHGPQVAVVRRVVDCLSKPPSAAQGGVQRTGYGQGVPKRSSSLFQLQPGAPGDPVLGAAGCADSRSRGALISHRHRHCYCHNLRPAAHGGHVVGGDDCCCYGHGGCGEGEARSNDSHGVGGRRSGGEEGAQRRRTHGAGVGCAEYVRCWVFQVRPAHYLTSRPPIAFSLVHWSPIIIGYDLRSYATRCGCAFPNAEGVDSMGLRVGRGGERWAHFEKERSASFPHYW
jgi:hypothetical protein